MKRFVFQASNVRDQSLNGGTGNRIDNNPIYQTAAVDCLERVPDFGAQYLLQVIRLAAGQDQPLIVHPGGVDYKVRSRYFYFGTSSLRAACRISTSLDFESYKTLQY